MNEFARIKRELITYECHINYIFTSPSIVCVCVSMTNRNENEKKIQLKDIATM